MIAKLYPLKWPDWFLLASIALPFGRPTMVHFRTRIQSCHHRSVVQSWRRSFPNWIKTDVAATATVRPAWWLLFRAIPLLMTDNPILMPSSREVPPPASSRLATGQYLTPEHRTARRPFIFRIRTFLRGGQLDLKLEHCRSSPKIHGEPSQSSAVWNSRVDYALIIINFAPEPIPEWPPGVRDDLWEREGMAGDRVVAKG